MKNILSCGAGRNHHNQETSSLARGSEFSNLMNYFWNYMDPSNTYSDTTAANFELEPRMQVVETKDAVQITAELPGIKEDDLDLKISSDGYLSLCGEKKTSMKQQRKMLIFPRLHTGLSSEQFRFRGIWIMTKLPQVLSMAFYRCLSRSRKMKNRSSKK